MPAHLHGPPGCLVTNMSHGSASSLPGQLGPSWLRASGPCCAKPLIQPTPAIGRRMAAQSGCSERRSWISRRCHCRPRPPWPGESGTGERRAGKWSSVRPQQRDAATEAASFLLGHRLRQVVRGCRNTLQLQAYPHVYQMRHAQQPTAEPVGDPNVAQAAPESFRGRASGGINRSRIADPPKAYCIRHGPDSGPPRC
jgi:hypothetical protein